MLPRTPTLLLNYRVQFTQRHFALKNMASMRSCHRQRAVVVRALLLLSAFYFAAHLPAAYAHRLSTTNAALTDQQPLFNITRLAANHDHACALIKDGKVTCWGANGQGQLGDGTTIHRSQAVPVIGLTGAVTELATGAEHTCTVSNHDTVHCWGNNEAGQLGNGTTGQSSQYGKHRWAAAIPYLPPSR